MQGLFFSVTTTFSALVLTLALYVHQHREELVLDPAREAYMAQAQATYFIQTLQEDIENMIPAARVSAPNEAMTCRLSMTRDGRTRSFTFPTVRYPKGASTPSIVHVTYELEGQARQIETRKGTRDLYRLRRYIDEGGPMLTLGGSNPQIVDFLVELFPNVPGGESDLRVLSGNCPADLDQVRVEFRVAVPETAATDSVHYAATTRYTTTVRPRREEPVLLTALAD